MVKEIHPFSFNDKAWGRPAIYKTSSIYTRTIIVAREFQGCPKHCEITLLISMTPPPPFPPNKKPTTKKKIKKNKEIHFNSINYEHFL